MRALLLAGRRLFGTGWWRSCSAEEKIWCIVHHQKRLGRVVRVVAGMEDKKMIHQRPEVVNDIPNVNQDSISLRRTHTAIVAQFHSTCVAAGPSVMLSDSATHSWGGCGLLQPLVTTVKFILKPEKN